MPTHLKPGDPAPGFSLPAPGGRTVSLADFRGRRNLVLYFYPKDDTPGCTREACSFREDIPRYRDSETEVFGVSADDIASHEAFGRKYGLNFTLLSDPDGATARAYGVWNAAKSCASRATFLIDREGIVRSVWPEVRVEGHSAEVQAAVAALRKG